MEEKVYIMELAAIRRLRFLSVALGVKDGGHMNQDFYK